MEWVVGPEESGMKLLAFLVKKVEGYSAKALKRAIENNASQINGRTERFATTQLGHGDKVNFIFKTVANVDFDLRRILYEDEALLAYNKPAGINCDEAGIAALLKKYDSSLKLVHRLDRNTTGVLLFAKSETVFHQLVEQFVQHQIHKTYKVIVDGVIKKNKGLIENYLVKKRAFAGQTIWEQRDSQPGLKAITEWECIQRGKETTLVTCYPKTGRTHQLRVHMAGMGHPILGDFQYGKIFKCAHRPDRYLLHAEEIELTHPLKKIKLKICAPLPKDFIRSQQELFEGGEK